jgi:hypothetical protein
LFDIHVICLLFVCLFVACTFRIAQPTEALGNGFFGGRLCRRGDIREAGRFETTTGNLVAQQGEQHAEALGQSNFEPGKRGINDLIRIGVPERQRSEVFQSVVFRLANAGLSIIDIEEALAEYPNGIAQKYANRLRAEIERSYGNCLWADRIFAAAKSDGLMVSASHLLDGTRRLFRHGQNAGPQRDPAGGEGS